MTLNVVCFSYGDHSANGRIVERLQHEGEVAPSLTIINGIPAIRAAIVNHRTRVDDVLRLVDGVLRSEPPRLIRSDDRWRAARSGSECPAASRLR